MKKRIVIALCIIIILVIMANRGSYSWFTSKATAGGSSISTGILSLEVDGTKDASGKVTLFNARNLVPVNIEDPDTPGIAINPITIRNTGTIDFIFYDTLVDTVYVKDNVPWGGDTDEGQTGLGRFANFKIRLTADTYRQDGTVVSRVPQTMSLEEMKANLKDILEKEVGILKAADGSKPGEYVVIGGKVWLDKYADMDYQGVNTSITLTLKVKQLNDSETMN